MESDLSKGHFNSLPISSITEKVVASPKVNCDNQEIQAVIVDLKKAVEDESYKAAIPTAEKPSLSDDYIFDKEDEKMILSDLKLDHFVAKVKDLSKGAAKRKKSGLPQEYLYIFQYPCELIRRDADTSGIEKEKNLIYIKINVRKVPYQIVIVVSFHKNNPKV